MAVSLYDMSVESFVPMLKSLSAILDKAAGQTAAKKDASDDLVEARLAPDMYTLARQIELSCRHARETVARLTQTAPPKIESGQKTIAELKSLIALTLSYLGDVKGEKFAGAARRRIEFAGPPGMVFRMTGHELLRDWGLPHFYFHAVTAYDILRHKGIEIGKPDYLSNVGKYIRRA